jgi:hypothetical protein
LRKLFFFGILAVTLTARGRWDEEGRDWWKHVEYLASDDMQGRNVGSHGFDLAANYVAAQYENSGLKPAGSDGYYFQKIWFAETALNSAHLKLIHGGHETSVNVPSTAIIHFNMYSPREVKARVVFAGYGMRIPEAGYDDFKGLAVKGAIVAYIPGGPACIPGDLRSHYGSTEARWKALHAAGAVGMIAIPNPRKMESPWTRLASTWSSDRMSLTDPEMNHLKYLQFDATWNPERADELFAGTGHTFAQILEADEKQSGLPHFATEFQMRADVSVHSWLVPSKNIVAVHPGSDERLKDEFVVISAHLDHLGMTKPVHGDRVYNGAMDDASGVSSVIEIARMMKGVATRRSLIFLALTGEEKGELGSEYFARYPTVPGRMVADLNMDMFLPLIPLKSLEVQGLDESSLGADVKAVAEADGVKIQADQVPDKDRFIRSDQYSFVKAGIPALAFKFGYEKGGPEEKIFQQWYATRYHGLKDDIHQPVDVAAAAEFDDILKLLLVRVADEDQPPHWNQDSFFKRFTEQRGM